MEKQKSKVYKRIEKIFQNENLFYENELDQQLFDLLIRQCHIKGNLDEEFFRLLGSENPNFTSRVSAFQMKYEAYPLSINEEIY